MVDQVVFRVDLRDRMNLSLLLADQFAFDCLFVLRGDAVRCRKVYLVVDVEHERSFIGNAACLIKDESIIQLGFVENA
jgi:hypothetical protein